MFKNIRDHRLEGKDESERCRLTQLYILDIFVEICEKHNLRYWLTSGSLLGALRHKGFIPWDDDIDVGMLKPDYDRFIEIAKKELPKNLLLQTPEAYPGVFEVFAKIRDRSSFYCEVVTNVRNPCGIFIDIFPFDPFPLFKHKIFTDVLNHGLSLAYRKEQMHRAMGHRFIVGILLSFFAALSWRCVRLGLRLVLNVCLLFRKRVWHERPEKGRSRAQWSDEWLFPLAKHEFCGKKYNVPKEAEACLDQIYFGDWKTLPPENERQRHTTIVSSTIPPPAPWAMSYVENAHLLDAE